MKIKGEMYKELDRQIEVVFNDFPVETFDKLFNHIKENKRIKSPSIAFMWQIYFAAMDKHKYSWKDIKGTEDLKGIHIDTALKRIIPNYYPAIKAYLK